MTFTNKGVAMYCRVGNYYQTLKDNCVLYVYSRDIDSLNRQETVLKEYCDSKNIKYSGVCKDLGGSNFLENKKELLNLINTNYDIDIIISSASRVGRNMIDTLNLLEMCDEKNIRIYDIESNNYLLDNLKQMKNVLGEDYGL